MSCAAPPHTEPPRKVPSSTLKAAARYERRLLAGELIMRDATGRMQWASGSACAPTTVRHLLATGAIAELDTDLFGHREWGQTIGKEAHHG